MVIDHLVDVITKNIFVCLTVQFLINRNTSTAIGGCCDVTATVDMAKRDSVVYTKDSLSMQQRAYNAKTGISPGEKSILRKTVHESPVPRLTVCRLRFSLVHPYRSLGTNPQKPASPL